MKDFGIRWKISISAIIFIFALALVSCASNKIAEMDFPPEPEVDEVALQQLCIDARPTYFTKNDEFIYLGKIGEYHIAHNSHFWGNGRMTGRIVIFLNKKVIGNYGGISDCPQIKGDYIYFDCFPEKYGNTIDLSNGIPDKVYLDGYHFLFEYF